MKRRLRIISICGAYHWIAIYRDSVLDLGEVRAWRVGEILDAWAAVKGEL